jgi:hypothetical protein
VECELCVKRRRLLLLLAVCLCDFCRASLGAASLCALNGCSRPRKKQFLFTRQMRVA